MTRQRREMKMIRIKSKLLLLVSHVQYNGQHDNGDTITPPFPTVISTVDENDKVKAWTTRGPC